MRFLNQHSPFSGDAIIGTGLLLLGGSTILGWLLHVPVMFMLWYGLLPMVFNTGMGFLLSGIALLLTRTHAKPARLLRQGIAIALMVFGSLILYEQIFDVSLGIDFAALHTWYDYGNTRPGRMAPNTASGFILIGAVVYFSGKIQSRRQALWVVLLTFCLLAIGLTGLVGYLLSPELLYNWARSARMALHTAGGMISCAVGLWIGWSRSHWYESEQYFREEWKIRILSAAIFIVSMITIGLVGFVLLQGNLEKASESRLEAIVYSRGPWFSALTTDIGNHAEAAVTLSSLPQYSADWLAHPGDDSADAAKQVAALSQKLVRAGYRGLMVADNNGRALHVAGLFNPQPEITAALDAQGKLALVWHDELIVRRHLPVLRDGQTLGRIIIDRAVPALRGPLFDMAKLGNSAELSVCVGRDQQLLCFPNPKSAKPFLVPLVPMRTGTALPLPMQLALAGKKGIVYGTDYRGNNVLAAYSQLAPGLGIVAKQATADAYAGIRNSLKLGAPIIFGVSLLGALFLVLRLNPLVAKMRASELAAADSAAEMETIMEAAGDGIVTINQMGQIESINIAACQIFCYARDEAVGMSATRLMPSAVYDGQREDMALLATGEIAHLLGAPNLMVQGIRKGGETFPLEISINAVTLARRRLFVAVIRDITMRKEMDDKLFRLANFDTLTGLPNRALFMDRLATALARTTRNGGVLALMFLDLDGFKAVNDTFGHEGGDILLQQVSTRLQALVRSSDTVARLAGDEFTIILENFSQSGETAVAVAEKIVNAFQMPFQISGREANVTVSIGLIVHDTAHAQATLPDLLRKADNEMYAVKRRGKNGLQIAEPGAAELNRNTNA